MKTLRVIVWAVCLAACAQTPAGAPAIDPDRFLDHVKFLASERLKGRGNGTPELDIAAHYIADAFRTRGLAPAAGRGSYLQPFTVTTHARLGASNQLGWTDGKSTEDLTAEADFRPLNFSSSAAVSGAVVFAGYGITAKEYGYDDYSGINARGKIVIVMRHEPREFDEKGPFAGRTYTVHSQLPWKAATARAHGAAAVLYVNDVPNHTGESDEFEPFGRSVGPGEAGIPFVQVKAATINRLLASANKTLEDVVAQMEASRQPRSFALPSKVRVHLKADVSREPRTVNNVAGYLEGATGEYVVLGAHYDHIGIGEQYSMAPSETGKTHFGADDNASGTAGLIELAAALAARPKHKRGFLFLAFAGEELGLLGSSHWVRNPGMPPGKAVAMINLDMIGRIRDARIQLGGEPPAKWRKGLDALCRAHGLKPEFSEPPGAAASDHSSFAARPMPVLFFFSGLHSDYHTPADTWDKIERVATSSLLRVVVELGERLATAKRPGELD